MALHHLQCMKRIASVAFLFCVSLPAATNPFDPVRGSWQGAVQFESTESAEAHAVGLMTAHIGADGEIDAIHPNGCKLSGVIAMQSVNFYQLDARTQGCSYAPLNRRWSGYVAYKQGDRVLAISGRSSYTGADGKFRQLDFSGTLQR